MVTVAAKTTKTKEDDSHQDSKEASHGQVEWLIKILVVISTLNDFIVSINFGCQK